MKKVLVVSDPAFISDDCHLSTTGFAIAGGQIIQALKDDYKVVHLARGARISNLPDGFPCRVIECPSNDIQGSQYIVDVCGNEKPDLIVMEGDPDSVYRWTSHNEVLRYPILLHLALEGKPVIGPWADTIKNINDHGGIISTYTNYAAGAILEKTGILPVVIGLGCDHAPFKPVPQEYREVLREKLGWTDKFVVMNVARNAGRKNWQALFKAMKHLKNINVLLYAHCVPYERFNLGGWNLTEMASEYHLGDSVSFNESMRYGSPYSGVPYQGEFGLIELYQAADLFVAPTTGEGWNIPATEAAACGLPVVTTRTGGGWEVARNFAEPLMDFMYIASAQGVEMAFVSPENIVAKVGYLSKTPDKLKKMKQLGLEESKKLTWSNFRDSIRLQASRL